MEAEQHQTNFFAQTGGAGTGGNSAVGTVLREAREQGRHDLAIISEELHIRARYLLAIEEGRFRDLPGPTYALGFVRTYATYLGLDASELVRRFKEETATLSRRPELVFPAGAVEKTLPAGLMVAVALVLAAIVYGLWYFLHSHTGGTAELIQPAPHAVASSDMPPAPDSPAPYSPTGAGSAASGVLTGVTATASAGTTGAGTTAAPAPASPGFALPPQSPVMVISPAQASTSNAGNSMASATSLGSVVIPPLPTGTATLPVPQTVAAAPKLVVHATGTTWVRVRDSNGAMLYSETMHRNDEYKIPDKPGLRLRLGNAKYISLLLNGKPLPADLVVSAEKKDLALDPGKLAPAPQG